MIEFDTPSLDLDGVSTDLLWFRLLHLFFSEPNRSFYSPDVGCCYSSGSDDLNMENLSCMSRPLWRSLIFGSADGGARLTFCVTLNILPKGE